MHLKVLSSLVLALMADGLPNLCSKKLVDSHMHLFLSGALELFYSQHMYRTPIMVDKRMVLLEKYIRQLPKI